MSRQELRATDRRGCRRQTLAQQYFPAVGEHADQQLVVEPPLARDSSGRNRRQRGRRHQLDQSRPKVHHTNVRANAASVEGRLVTMHAAGSSSLSG